MDDLTNPNPGNGVAANPTTEPAPVTGTVQTNSQAGNGQGAPVEESFTKLDPNTLPPQLKQAYDNMLRDYKTKTTELSEQRKKYDGYDAYKQKADLYEQLASQEDFVKAWNDHVQKVNGAQTQGQADSATEELKAKLQEIESKIQQSELAEVVDAFSTAKDEKGELIHPDFDSLNGITIGTTPQGDEFSLLRACIELSPGNGPQEKLANGYKAAKQIRDQIFEEGRKHAMGKMLSKVRNSSEAPTLSTDKSLFTGDAKNLSVREARELAAKGVSAR